MNSVELIGLTKIYNKTVLAVDALDLKIPESCIFGLLGPNGAGKSSIINMLAGIVRRTSGEILVSEKRISDDDFEYKRNIGFVLESPCYIEKLTAEEYLEFVGSMYGIGKTETTKLTQELIEFFDLGAKRNEWIETYSSGMKKKVSLAAALMHRPKVLILDEPLEGIDPVSAKRIKENLRLMSNKGTSVLITSHVLETMERLCDEVAIIHKGKLVFQSKTEDISKKIKNEVSQETYQSLEEIFVDIVSEEGGEQTQRKLSWL
jgi:ABC-2 type transport system ATP-binding protein